MDFLSIILWPIRWVIELILVAFHTLWTSIGMDANAGITWILSIVGLVVVVRALLIPVFVKQIRSQRRMLEIAGPLKKIQEKYKGKKDTYSREAMQRETMALYKKHGTNPFSSCLPLLLQMPVFFSLYSVLNDAQHYKAGVGVFSEKLAKSLADSTFLGAPLKETFIQAVNANTSWSLPVMIVAVTMIILMTSSQFITQLQIVSKNMSDETKASPMFRQQRIMLYILPLVFAFSGVFFPLGVMFYWLTTNFWTMAQQFVVIRRMPNPGSEAARAREERLIKKGKSTSDTPGVDVSLSELEPPKPAQRQQPTGKNRAKKKGKK